MCRNARNWLVHAQLYTMSLNKYSLLASALMLVALCSCKSDPLATMPEFSFRLSDSITIMNTKEIPTDKPIVMVYFEADCRDCQQTIDSLLQNSNKVNNVRFYFLTVERFSQVRLFQDYYKVQKYSNITVAQDYTRFLPAYFKTYKTPQIALYNSKKELQGIFNGKPKVELLIEKILSIH